MKDEPYSLLDDDTLGTTLAPTPLVVADWGFCSEQGPARSINQDRWGQGQNRLFIVADGIGGVPGGHVASASVVTHLLSIDPSGGWIPALTEVNLAVRSDCAEAGFVDAGSTVVMLLVEQARSIIVSSGDSRIFRLRDGKVTRLTVDHARSVNDQQSGTKTRALSTYFGRGPAGFVVDLATTDNAPGDRYLLCSDGVYGPLSFDQLVGSLSTSSAELAAKLVVERAHQNGGGDDATALVVDLVSTDDHHLVDSDTL